MIASPVILSSTCGATRCVAQEILDRSAAQTGRKRGRARKESSLVDPTWDGPVAILDRQVTTARGGFTALSTEYHGGHYSADDFGNQG